MISRDNARYLAVLAFALVFAIVPSVLMGAPTGYETGLPESQATEISACGILNTSNTVYTLTRNLNESDVNSTGCFNITARNITLDCQNFFIRNLALAKPGIYSNQINTTITNCNVTMSTGGYGIHFFGANNSFIYNSTLNSQYCGIYLQRTINVTVNNITTNSNSAYGIFLSTSSNNNLISITSNSNSQYGIYLSSTSSNNQFTNITANLNGYGIWLQSGSNNNFTNITANLNGYGLFFTSSNSNQFTNITLNSNSYGIYLSSSAFNIFKSIILRKSSYAVYMAAYTNNFTSNEFSDNLNSFSTFSTNSQQGTAGNRIDFNITMKYINGSNCPLCSYKLDLYPSESSFVNSSSSSLITGNFTPAKTGIYSLKINITDNKNNSETRKYVYWINATATDLVNYYFRDTVPTHGQPLPLSGDDSSSLLFEKPTSTETISCAVWVQFSPDILPDYLYGIYKQINYSIWHRTGATATNWTGVQRYATYNNVVDYNTTVSATSTSFGTFNFSVDWTNDYSWSWYQTSIKLAGAIPYVYSYSTAPSFANITYTYPNTPAIKSLSNEDIDILSATMDSNTSTTANITLDGTGNTTIVIQMPVTGVYDVSYDNIACLSNANCTINSNANGLINLTLILGSEHNITIQDTTAPSITIISPENRTYNTILFNITATDNVAIGSCWYSLNNGINNFSMTNTSSTSYNATNTSIADGSYTAKFYCNDTSNNINNTETRGFSIDTVKPIITLISPAEATSSTTNAYNFTFNVSDASNIDNCSLIIDNAIVSGNTTAVSKTAENGIYKAGLSVAIHTWQVNCTDSAGNTGNSTTRSLTVTSPTTTTMASDARRGSTTTTITNTTTNATTTIATTALTSTSISAIETTTVSIAGQPPGKEGDGTVTYFIVITVLVVLLVIYYFFIFNR